MGKLKCTCFNCECIHLKNLAIYPDQSHKCGVQGCPQTSLYDLAWDNDDLGGQRQGTWMCGDHFDLLMVPYLPDHDSHGTPVPWAAKQQS